MANLIIVFSSVVLILVVIIFTLIGKIKSQIKQLNEKEKEKIRQVTEDEKERLRQIELLETRQKAIQERLEDTLKHERDLVKQEINNIRQLEEQKLKNDLELDRIDLKDELEALRQAELKKMREEHEKILGEMLNERKETAELLEPLRKELIEYRAKREAVNADILRAEKMQMDEAFHRIILDILDKEDIQYLLSIEGKVHNKDVLRKLIWSTYLIKPTNDMLNRILEGKNKVSGVYKITDPLGRPYIGKSVDVRARLQQHVKSSVNVGTISHQAIHDEFKKQGIENFTFELLEECSRDEIGEREKYYIDFYESNIYGFNERKGG